ncbi:MAG TPA: glucoamylase family protein [Polyangiaceae bacterium]
MTIGGLFADTAAVEPVSRHHGRTCPALLDDTAWDDPTLLRGEIHTVEQLSEHAAEVASAHGEPITQPTQGPLRKRFLDARRRITEAYGVLSRTLGRSRPASPAEEWLLDNAHVVEDQIREIKEDLPRSYLVELPRIAHGEMRGYPRVYGLCLDYLRHTDARVDLTGLSGYVCAYQTVQPLTIGELWAVPIMLRLGLVLAVGALAASEATERDRDRGDVWAARVIESGQTPEEVVAALTRLEKSDPPVTAPLVVELLRNLREHEAPLGAATEWVRAKCETMKTTPEELTRRQHLRLAADQVSVGNAITSMRAIGALDWNEFFERTSTVEAVLRSDPAGAYGAMDVATRDRYRHVVEKLARRSAVGERAVAEAALALARETTDADVSRSHVGFWLIGEGRPSLESRTGYRPTVAEAVARPVLAHPAPFYLGALLLFTAVTCALAALVGRPLLQPWLLALLVVLFALPASEMAVAVVNSVVVAVVPPRVLPKMSFAQGIPVEQRTLVVVPALLDRAETVRDLLLSLEIRSLGNLDKYLHFALLTDFCDSDTEDHEGDDALLAVAREGIARLNARWEGAGEHRYMLLHRRRVRDASQGCWMGWERKRGKLTELNRLLRGRGETTFTVVTAPGELLESVRCVITLDADTELPRDVARELVATLAHPLNRPRVDPKTRRVARGHGIIQPRVGTLPVSSRRTRYSRIASGPVGLDPYTTAVSDVYQDLFDEGSYVGKGIYDVDAFASALEGRVPEGRLLSHDLFEGIFARSALATDIEVLDEQPTSYEVAAGRLHRWVRGDWQMLPWLLRGARRRELHAIDAWKILDNLRRSLLPPAMVVSCFLGWFLQPVVAAWVTGTLAVMFVVPVLTRAVLNAARARDPRSFASALGGDVVGNIGQSLLHTIFLLDESLVALDAIVRTVHRMTLSHRNLLEWTTMGQAERNGGRHVHPRILLGSLLAVGIGTAVGVHSPLSLPFAVPVLALWATAPAVAAWLREPEEQKTLELTPSERKELRLVARRTWHFFERFVTAADHYLPPDNYQEEPRAVLARRTSPTNIGLYLLSVVSAHDFGFIDVRNVVGRLGKTLDAMDKLERREGHILNWFDTSNLRPLEPKYVSTVDSGNLAAYLWALREACAELAEAPLVRTATLDAADDALQLAANVSSHPQLDHLRASLAAAHRQLAGGARDAMRTLHRLSAAAAEVRDSPWATARDGRCREWIGRAAEVLSEALATARALAPFVERAAAIPGTLREALGGRWQALETLVDFARSPAALAAQGGELTASCAALEGKSDEARQFLAELQADVERARRACGDLTRSLYALGTRAGAMADGMSFGFLFDEGRKLFSIGYNVSSARLDGSHYDLLASEARLASLVAIAKGDASQEHWFRMGRQRARVSSSERVLLSWSGSMFEYLMPLLVTKSYEGTLLEETYRAVLDEQVAYGAKYSMPWGVSESAYNLMDLAMTYQYRAFGVPGLGLKAGLAEDRVVAPYATALAALVRPRLAIANFRDLARLKMLGEYGFYDAVDFTPGRLPPGRSQVLVKTFMAHHQGMTLVALDNTLHDSPMQRRFHRDPRIKATELLLEERIPERTPLVTVTASSLRTPTSNEPDLDVVEHVGLGARPLARIHLLGHGELSAAVTVLGEGFTTWKDLDVHRFREDQALEAGGIYLYVRDHTAKTVWSAGYQPTKTEPDFYDVAFAIDRVEIHRRDGDIETTTEITVSPEHTTEVRRVTLTNHGSAAHDLDLTTYTEVVLAPRAADVAHRAFASMFIETEALAEHGAVLARRRPRSRSEGETWLAQVLSPEGPAWRPGFEHETSRPRFIGRGRTTADPVGLEASLSGTTGVVLDPALVLRRAVRLEPGGRARVTLATSLATSRDECLELVARYSMPNSIQRTFELAWADARVELKHIGITAAQSHRFQRLLSAVLFPQAGLRAAPERAVLHGRGRSGLWSHGLTSDLPIVLVRVDDHEFAELLREVLLAQWFWRLNGVTADLIVLNEEPAGYMQPQQEALMSLVRSSPSATHLDQRGGVFVRRARDMTDEELALLSSDSRVVLAASRGSLARQLGKLATQAVPRPRALPLPRNRPPLVRAPTEARPELVFDNGVGGFTEDGREYTMTLTEACRTPQPWCNVLANAHFGALVSESGASFTWYHNSQRHRLTPWSNDAVCDPSGESFWLRDDEDGSVWSPTPQPAGAGADYVVRHGIGYSRFEHTRGELAHELVLSVSPTDSIKTWHLILRNRGRSSRRLTLLGVVEWVMGSSRESSRVSTITEWDATESILLVQNPLSLFPERRAFFTSTMTIGSVSGDRDEIFGVAGSRARPVALRRVGLSGRVGSGFDPCGALEVSITMEPGETFEGAFILGEAENSEAARSLARAYRDAGSPRRVLAAARDFWRDVLGAVVVKTPDRALDFLVNGWLLHQILSCRVWGRSAFYQSGGAYGFRDQIQDVLALLHTRPDIAREHLLRAAARQFLEGDVQHWWHDGTGEGVRTRCSDDMLWLPYAVAHYVKVTGDSAVLDVQVPFLAERALKAEDEDIFGIPKVTPETATLYDHCTRALDVGATSGRHGLPKMGSGDWNDGMNRVGRGGQGESVWLAWFLARTALDFSDLAKARGDTERVGRCEALVPRLAEAVDAQGWDGAWYRRAYFDDGKPLGARGNTECSIDAIAQSWAVIAGIGDRGRARQALRSSEEQLVRRDEALMRLLWPPFDKTDPDPGYIRAYPGGIRENGGQYTHGVLWTVQALALLGEGDRAVELLSLLNPIHHASTGALAGRYQVEPYVVAADVYDAPGHVGRGGWTWYTGAAGWMYRIVVEHLLGVRREGSRLVVDPCISSAWKGFEVTYRDGDGELHVVVDNPDGVQRGVRRIEVDGREAPAGGIALTGATGRREVRVIMGSSGGSPTAE